MMGALLPDIPRYHTAIAEWLACMVFILILRRRLRGWKLAGVSAAAFILQAAFLVLTGNVQIYFWLPCMITAVLFMIGFLYLSIEGSIWDAVYCGMQAFIIAEFAASFEWQIHFYFFQEKATAAGDIITMTVTYALVYLVIWKIWTMPKFSDGMLHVHLKELAAVFITAAAVFTVGNLSFLPVWTPFSEVNSVTIGNIRTMVDFAGVAMIYAYFSQRSEIRARQELDVMHNVLQNQYLQYQQSKESIDLINYKYHDLKHQIAVLRAEEDPKRRLAFLDEMEEEIHRYEVQNKTGNKVLDTILTSKNVTCEKFGISLNSVADGALLDFMDTLDICSIFGNALDNAIECEKKVEEKEKRLIHLAVFSQKNFVIVRVENYFDGKLELENGVPRTTKTKKKEFHGFGIRSIQYTARKYEGAVSISQRERWFELKVLIPMKKALI